MNINLLLLGANAMASLVVGLLFLRFWRDTHDRFFLFFALAFGVEGLNRVAIELPNARSSAGSRKVGVPPPR